MAFRRNWLEAINGFDPQFCQAGDDVDICWRTREQGGRLRFSPAAMVWHHYRRTVRAYWKQQIGYGKAEAMLERKSPEKYNSGGHATWAGRIYVNGIVRTLSLSRGRIYQGTWGTAGYARLDQPAPNLLNSLPLMHEWQLMNLVLAVLCALGMVWRPLLSLLPVAVATFGLSLVSPISAARNIRFPRSAKSGFARFRLRVLTVMLHLMQPWARLWSRLIYSLTVGRIRRFPTISLPWPRTFLLWSEKWIDNTTILHSLESLLRSSGAVVRRGGDYDRWDLEIRGGLFGGIRIRTVSETYGRGKHSLRLHFRPWFSISGAGTTVLLTTACFGALLDRSVYAATILGILSAMFGAITFRSGAVAIGAIHRTLIKLDFERI